MNILTASVTAVIGLFPYFLVALALFYLGKLLFDVSTPHIEDDKELTQRDNPAFGVFFVGYMLGLAFAIASSLDQLGPSIRTNLIDLAISGVAAILLLRLSMTIAGWLILRHFKIESAIVKDRNVGAGIAYGGLFMASGLVIAGVMSGRSDSYLEMVRDIVIYWAVAQAFFVGAWYLFRLIARYDVGRMIEQEKSVAVGLSLAGFFIATGIILKAALTGAGSDLPSELLVTVVLGILGLIVLAAARALTAVVLLPKANLADEVSRQGNIAAGAVSAVSFVAVAVLFSALVISQVK